MTSRHNRTRSGCRAEPIRFALAALVIGHSGASTSTVFFVQRFSVMVLSRSMDAFFDDMPRDWLSLNNRSYVKPGHALHHLRPRQLPEFFDIVADRIWQALWGTAGHPLDYSFAALREHIHANTDPVRRAPNDGTSFLGTASVIAPIPGPVRNSRHGSPAVGWRTCRRRRPSAARWSTARAGCFALAFSALSGRAPPRTAFTKAGLAAYERDVVPHLLTYLIRMQVR